MHIILGRIFPLPEDLKDDASHVNELGSMIWPNTQSAHENQQARNERKTKVVDTEEENDVDIIKIDLPTIHRQL